MEIKKLTKNLYRIAWMTFPILASAFVVKEYVKDRNLEQKTQNEIIIDSTKVDSTNYQSSFNYIDYNKK